MNSSRAAADRAAAWLELAGARYLSGEYDAALAACERAAAPAAQTEDGRRAEVLAAAALVVRGLTFPTVVAVTTELGRRALAEPGLSPASRARVLPRLATSAGWLGHADEAVRDASEAVRLAEACGDARAVLDATEAAEATLLEAGASRRRLEIGDLAVRHAAALGEPVAAVIAHGWRLRAGYELARLDVVADALSQMAAGAQRSRLPLAGWHHLRAACAVATLEGRFGEAVELSRRALALSGDDLGQQSMYWAHAEGLAVLRGDPSALPPGFDVALGAAPAMTIVQSARANALLLRGDRDAARSVYERLAAHLATPDVDGRWGGVLHQVTDLVVAFDDAEAAVVLAGQLAPYAAQPGVLGTPTVYFTGSMARHLGRALVVAGRLDEAEASLRRGLAINEATGAAPYAALTRLDLAELLLTRAERAVRAPSDEAATLARAAAADARRLDLPGPLARADALLRRLAAARHAADPLTPREREVADLVVRALTNREIAVRLVLSERTVESHVRSLLAKLGHASRTELIAARLRP